MVDMVDMGTAADGVVPIQVTDSMVVMLVAAMAGASRVLAQGAEAASMVAVVDFTAVAAATAAVADTVN
jgi:hypothetical protein